MLPVQIAAPLMQQNGLKVEINPVHVNTIVQIVKQNLNQWTAQVRQNPAFNAQRIQAQGYEFVVTPQGKAYLALEKDSSATGCFKGSRKFVKVAGGGNALSPELMTKIKTISFANLFTLTDRTARREFDRELALHADFKQLRKQGKLSHVVSGTTMKFADGAIAIKTKNFNRGDIQHRLKEYNSDGKHLNMKMFRSHAKSIAKGLSELHSLKKAHMDVKPDNTVANTNKSEYTTARLIDLGKVRTIGEAYDGTSGPIGLYAPEAIRGVQNPHYKYQVFTAENDMYSYGLLLYFMAAGIEAATWARELDQMSDSLRTGATVVDKFLAKREKVKKWPRFNSLPKKVQELILACTRKEPNKRLKAAAVVKQLKEWKV